MKAIERTEHIEDREHREDTEGDRAKRRHIYAEEERANSTQRR